MADTALSKERRRHPRYKMLEVAAVVGERRLAHILDMSIGGVAFSYIQMRIEDDESIDLGIIFGPDGRYLQKLPAEIVSDTVLSHGPPHHPVIIRRRSMRFTDLSGEQKEQLAEFISRHTNCGC